MRYFVNVDPKLNISKEDLKNSYLPAIVNFHGEFSEDSAIKFRENLENAEEIATRINQKIIPIVIDSYGGCVYSLLSMIDSIKACNLPVATIIEGKAMSCGAVLFSFGKEGNRYIGPNATIMIHTVSSFSWGKIDEMKASTTEADRLNDKLFEMMSINCGHKPEYFSNELKNRKMADWFLDSKESVHHNLANKIKIPSVKIDIKCDYSFE